MDAQVINFVCQCLHCVDSEAGEMVTRRLGETVDGVKSGKVPHYDYLYVGEQWTSWRRLIA